ncbi:MAG: ribonuclease J [Anaerolineae bacterium]|nr:ribonuclease J [Anaerolineae bacterium]
MAQKLRIIPLGGLGEIGKNMTVYEYGRNMIVVDCGVMFPDSAMYGIDLVLPDYEYVIQNQDKLRGIVLTHGHMDHIAALPYLLREINVPVYGTPLTLGLVERQLKEKLGSHRKVDLKPISALNTLHLGPFRITPFSVAHSIPDSVGFVIDTPVGAVVHTGDYKLDETPAGGRTTDLAAIRELTPNGVLAMLGDSTNADRPGSTPTERVVSEALDRLMTEAQGQRVIIATFSSLLARVQEILYLAKKHGRKVALTGRSMIENVELARDLGYLDVPQGILVDVDAHIPPAQMLIISTGSQGEPRSALNQMAEDQHRHVKVGRGDMIIISGGTIPGNEEVVGAMLNKLFEHGARVIYGPMDTVHVSGHGSRDEMRTMLETVQPKFFIPAHGEARHLHLHGQIAEQTGMDPHDIFILKDGAQWVTDGTDAWTDEALAVDDVFVDGRLVGEIGEVVMRDRHRLAQDGFIVALIPVNDKQQLVGEPQIVSRGFVYMQDADALLAAGQEEVKRQYKKGKHNLRRALEDFFYRETRLRPVVLPQFITV